MNRKCKNCNEPLHPKDVFCTACGSPVSSLSIEEQQDLAPQLTLEATFTPIEEPSGLQPALVTAPEPIHEGKTAEAPAAEKLPPSQEPTPEPTYEGKTAEAPAAEKLPPSQEPVSVAKAEEPEKTAEAANEEGVSSDSSEPKLDPASQPEPALKAAIPQEDQGPTQWTPPPDPYKIKKRKKRMVILLVVLILVALIAGWVFWRYI